ncbi:MAG: hypothetical protein ABFD89_26970 [Bryobacteraceae bacterium]
MIKIAEARPPYVTFEFRAEEDRAASIEAGHYVSKDVPFVLVTPMGSKDRHESPADEWFARREQDAAEGRFPREWLSAFKGAFAEWKAGREIPLNGTSVTNWPVASPAQVKMLLDLKVRTVEDLAEANEETLNRLGMGGRTLKQKAQDWLASASDRGKVSEQLAGLRADNEALKQRNEQLEKQLREVIPQFEALTKSRKL